MYLSILKTLRLMTVGLGVSAVFVSMSSLQAAELKNLDFRGFVRYEKTHELYWRSRLLIHTSLREGFPNVFLQAWECGTPVVSSCVTSLP